MNAILETALGLALVYLLVCMLSSAVQELIACYCNKRGHFLREGLNSLIPDRWTYLRTINHPSIVAFYRYVPGKGPVPSYLPARTVAQALCDVLVRRHQMLLPDGGRVAFDLAAIKAAVRHAMDRESEMGQALLPLTEGANTLDEAVTAIAEWVESSMRRVTGWYKAYAQKQLFFIGLVVAVVLNIDSIAIVEALARQPALRAEMAIAAVQIERNRPDVEHQPPHPLREYHAQFTDLAAKGLPIGYACLGAKSPCDPGNIASWPLKIAGFLLTAVAAMLGAPFWFDLVNRVINLRGSGIKPDMKAR